MRHMRTLQITAPGRAELVELPIPEPGAGEVLVRVSGVTTCPQWDLHLYSGTPMFVGQPLTYPYTPGQPGHEMTGTVEAIGEAVSAFRPGERASAWRDPGHKRPGCYAQYALMHQDNLLPVPPELTLAQTAPLELAMCVASTILDLKKLDGLRAQRVGICGLGPAGLVAVQYARAEGAERVIGLDLNAGRRARALALGLDCAVDPRDEEGQRLPLRGKAGAFDTSVDCVGSKQAAEFLMDHTNRVVALFGVQREEYAFRYFTLKLLGYSGHYRAAAEYALGQLLAGRLDLAALVSHILPLEAYLQGVELLRTQEATKILFLPWE